MRFTPSAEIPPAEIISDYDDVVEVCHHFESHDEPLGFDTETSGLDWDGLGVTVYCVGIADKSRRVAVLVDPENKRNLDVVLPFLDRTQHRHCGFNIQYDWNAIYGYTRWGLRMREPLLLRSCYADGMKLFCLFDEEGEYTFNNRTLKDRAHHYLGLPMQSFQRVFGKDADFLEELRSNSDTAADYATRDAWAHLGVVLAGKQIASRLPWCGTCPECGTYCFDESDSHQRLVICPEHGAVRPATDLTMWDWHRELDVPYLSVLQRMQVEGMPIDWEYLESCKEPVEIAKRVALQRFWDETSEALTERARNLDGPDIEAIYVKINPQSSQQLRKFYHGDRDRSGSVVGMAYPAQAKTESGGASTDKKSLLKLLAKYNAPGVTSLLEYRQLNKIYGTYIVGLQERRFPETNRIHGSFRAVTKTGRLASKDPNMQNYPGRDIRVQRPPAAGYVPEPQELMDLWVITEVEALEELDKPMYKPSVLVVNIRRAMRAPEGYKILCADYSQLEIRLTAHESGCQDLIKVLREGLDMHCYAAARAFKSVLPLCGYDDIYEAKQADDKDLGPRVLQFLKAATGDGDDLDALYARRVQSASSQQLEALGAARAALKEVLEVYPDFPATSPTQISDAQEAAQWFDALRDTGSDLYGVVASCLDVIGYRDKFLLGLRKAAKSAIFGIIYGIGPTALAAQITQQTGNHYPPEEARALIDSIQNDVFRGIGRMIRRQKRTVRDYGYVRTGMGRYRHPAGIWSGDSGRRAQAERQSSNSPIQGLAADVVQRAMLAIDTDDEMNLYDARLISQVHDELLILVPQEYAAPALERMKYLMETSHGLRVPVDLTVTGHAADTWDEAK